MEPNGIEPAESPESPAGESQTTEATPPTEGPRPGRIGRTGWVLAGVAATLATLAVLFLLSSRVYVYEPVTPIPSPPAPVDGGTVDSGPAKEIRTLQGKTKQARRSVRALVPRSVYIVVDTSKNLLQVKRGDETLLSATCSTGSGGLLKDPDTGRQWIFNTPRGKFQVIRKTEDPVWTKPDWAFVEEGKPVPEKWSERRDHDTLGDYALYFGDGYMIHGTLYQRYLGQSITHGCVRLGDEDLERVYRVTPLGAPILIF